MEKSVVFMFSGQGSQYYQMGREFFEQHPVFRERMIELNNIVLDVGGTSIIDELYNKKRQIGNEFSSTLYTHPAIFMVQYALTQILLEDGVSPDYVMGASLGEFVSAAVADVMSVKELLGLVIGQAQAFEFYCQNGGMTAIIYDSSLYKETPLIYENSELASVNFDSHFIISGRIDKLNNIEKFIESLGIVYQRLPVSYGFHSSLIDPAANYYLHFIRDKYYAKPQISLMSCLYGTQLTELPSDYFWQIARQPLKFPKAIRELEKEQSQNLIYLDLGPGGTLGNFAKRNIGLTSQSDVYAIMTPFNRDLNNLAKVKEVLTSNDSARKII